MNFEKHLLKQIIQNNALVLKKIKLSSGTESSYYFNIKKILLYPRYANLIASQIVNILIKENCCCIGGLALGAVPLVSAIVLKSWDLGHLMYGFYIRPKAKSHGLENQIEGYLMKGLKIYLVDDVITTGDSILNAINILEDQGHKVSKVIVVIDRSNGVVEQKLAKKNIKLTSLFLAKEFNTPLTNEN